MQLSQSSEAETLPDHKEFASNWLPLPPAPLYLNDNFFTWRDITSPISFRYRYCFILRFLGKECVLIKCLVSLLLVSIYNLGEEGCPAMDSLWEHVGWPSWTKLVGLGMCLLAKAGLGIRWVCSFVVGSCCMTMVNLGACWVVGSQGENMCADWAADYFWGLHMSI